MAQISYFGMDMVVNAGKSKRNVEAYVILPPDARSTYRHAVVWIQQKVRYTLQVTTTTSKIAQYKVVRSEQVLHQIKDKELHLVNSIIRVVIASCVVNLISDQLTAPDGHYAGFQFPCIPCERSIEKT